MGDELGLLNDASYLDDPRQAPTTTAGCTGRRWTGRRRSAGTTRRTVEGRLWAGLQRLIAARRATRAIHVQGVVEPIWTGNDHVFGALPRAGRRAPAGARQLHRRPAARAPATPCADFALTEAAADVDGRPLEVHQDFVVLAPYQHLWLHG